MPPSVEWVTVTTDLAYAWMRAGVLMGSVPLVGAADWTRIYPTITTCPTRVTIAGISGTRTLTACAKSASGRDSLFVALEDPSQTKARIAWETCNAVIVYHLNQPTLSDGPQVSACTSFVMANNP